MYPEGCTFLSLGDLYNSYGDPWPFPFAQHPEAIRKFLERPVCVCAEPSPVSHCLLWVSFSAVTAHSHPGSRARPRAVAGGAEVVSSFNFYSFVLVARAGSQETHSAKFSTWGLKGLPSTRARRG